MATGGGRCKVHSGLRCSDPLGFNSISAFLDKLFTVSSSGHRRAVSLCMRDSEEGGKE